MALITCKKCQRVISDNGNYCPYCKHVIKKDGKGYAIAGLILSIASCGYAYQAYIYALLIWLFNGLESFLGTYYYTYDYLDPYQNNSYSLFNDSLSNTMLLTIIISVVFTIVCSFLAITFGLVSNGKGCRYKMKNVAIILGIVSLILTLFIVAYTSLI